MATEVRADKDQAVEFAVTNGELVRPGTVLYYEPNNKSDTCEAAVTGIISWSVNSGDSVNAGDVVAIIEEVAEALGEEEEG
jgi:predicted deacylase